MAAHARRSLAGALAGLMVITTRKANLTLARIRDFALYIVIGVAVVGAASWWGYYQARVGGSPYLPMKWIAFASVTGIAFGYAIKGQRPNWRKPRLWAALGVLAAAHFAIGILVIWRISTLPLIVLAPFAGGECLAIAICLEYLVPAHRASSNERQEPSQSTRAG